MTRSDSFADLARYYDPLMREINYDRWFFLTTLIGEIVEQRPVRHLDLACGTARLIHRTRAFGWHSVGADGSVPMLRQAGKLPDRPHIVAADLKSLPFSRTFHVATCLFDSLNFLLEEDALRRALGETAGCLTDDGLFYLDVITERMVVRHFADQEWEEDNGRFHTYWAGRYDRSTRVAELNIRVSGRANVTIRERVYDLSFVNRALRDAGFTVLGEFDAETWEPPNEGTERAEYVACKNPSRDVWRRFRSIRERGKVAVRDALGSTHR